jgi:hypothetical protein
MRNSFKRGLAVGASTLALVLAFSPAALAGEDDDEDESDGGAQVAPAAGGGDSGVPVGGVQTGLGGTWNPEGTQLLATVLAGTGALALASAGGLAVSRRRRSH